MNELLKGLMKTLEGFHEQLSEKDKMRSRLIGLARNVVAYSGRAVRLMHQSKLQEVKELIVSAIEENSRIADILEKYPDLFASCQDAQKELTEAVVFQSILEGATIPAPDDLRVGIVSYLHGLADVVGELRRRMLNSMKDGLMGFAEETFQWMETIHGMLSEFTHYPDGITHAIRAEVDRTRGILEKSRGELAIIISQERLRDEIKAKK